MNDAPIDRANTAPMIEPMPSLISGLYCRRDGSYDNGV
jgi:hypothetical protein